MGKDVSNGALRSPRRARVIVLPRDRFTGFIANPLILAAGAGVQLLERAADAVMKVVTGVYAPILAVVFAALARR